MLTDLETVFHSLKSELGLRPTTRRAEGHWFITVIACQVVQVIRSDKPVNTPVGLPCAASSDDVLKGGAGADQLDGGSDVDTVSYAGSPAAVTVDLAARIGYFQRFH